MTIVDYVKQYFRAYILELAGQENLLNIIELQRATILDLERKNSLKSASYETQLSVNEDLKTASMRLFFYMPNSTMNNLFLDQYASLVLTQTEEYLKDFNLNFADVCINLCCGNVKNNIVPFKIPEKVS